MARKGSHPRSGVDRGATKTKHNGVLDHFPSDVTSNSSMNGEKIPVDEGLMNGNANKRFISPSGNNVKGSRPGSFKKNGRGGVVYDGDKSEVKTRTSEKLNLSSNKKDVEPGFASTESNEDLGISDGHDHISESTNIHNGEIEDDMKDKPMTSIRLAVKHLSVLAPRLLQIANMWVERQKPVINSFTTAISNALYNLEIKIRHVYPIIRSWIFHIGKILFLLSMVWLESSLRGLDSLSHLGTTSFFVIIWSSFFSILAMIGITKMLTVMVIASLVGVFIGLGIAILMTAISFAAILWFYGNFWTTMLVIVLGGAAFGLSHERLALFLTTMYSLYCVRYYMGWLGLFLGLNLSFLSSDVLIRFLRNNTENQESNIPPEEATSFRSQSDHFYTESMHASATTDSSTSAFGRSVEHDAGAASTSGTSAELTSEDEVLRLLNCSDHYSALGFARYESIDVSSLKREYRKKAMLVHPDKNMGNEKAAEAFKKLQNAYEVLLDSLKRKTYDAELRRQEILNYFRRFQSISRKNGRNGGPGLYQDSSGEGSTGGSRRIACKKCGDFHVWIHINRSKSRARWCQDCKDFHHAKDGDGWVEQSFQPLMFGMLHKMDPPHAYVCADSKIYDATEWFVCQGMRCPANSHKPTFHINTSVISSKHNVKGSHGTGETMTEEEFFEWLQNAMQSGSFEATGSAPGESPSPKTGGASKSSSKKKRKGKKAW